MLFMIYPTVSTATMSSFNCDENLGLLKGDYTTLCPSTGNLMFWWSILFFVVYPIGIPVFMHRACVFEGMYHIVTEKLDAASFQAMLSTFLHRGVSIEASRFARLVGNCSEQQFKRRADEEYDKLLKIQGHGKEINLDLLKDKVDHADFKMEGTSIKEIVEFMCLHDENGDRVLDRNEFTDMLKTAQDSANLFTGSEQLDRLTHRQLDTLLLYDDWEDSGDHSQDSGMVDNAPQEHGLEFRSNDPEIPVIIPKWHAVTDKATLNEATDKLEEAVTGEVLLELVRHQVAGQPARSLSVHVLEAKDLKTLNGSRDAYFTIHLGNDQGKVVKCETFTTQICKGTQNLKYDEQFELSLVKNGTIVVVSMYYKDYGNADDCIGDVKIDLAESDIQEVPAEREERFR